MRMSGLGRMNRTPVLASVAVLMLIIGAGVIIDPTGLIALHTPPQGGPLAVGGLRDVAPFLLLLPVLLLGTAASTSIVLRDAGPRAPWWWIFLLVWGATVLAAMIGRTAADLLAVAPLLASPAGMGALSFAETLGHLAWASGFTGVTALLCCWPSALTAALLHRRRKNGRTADTENPVVRRADRRMVIVYGLALVGFTGLVGPWLGGHWWAGSSLGFTYDHGLRLLAPSRAAGVVGYLVGLTILTAASVAVFAVLVRHIGARRRARSAFLAGWIATTLGASVLGLAQLLALLGTPSPADRLGGDRWWISLVLIRQADGLSYGLVVGGVAAGAVVLSAFWRPISGRPTSAGRLIALRRVRGLPTLASLAFVLILAAPLALSPTEPSRIGRDDLLLAEPGLPQGTGLPRLTVHPGEPAVLGTADGRAVLLRGVNVSDLLAGAAGVGEGSLAALAARGAGVIRVGVSWHRLEPEPGHVDEAYLAEIRALVDQAARHEVYTVLALHADLIRPATPCPGEPDREPTGPGVSSADVGPCASPDPAGARLVDPTDFAYDDDGSQTRLVNLWGRLAGEFATNSAVAGFHLLDDPRIGDGPPLTSGLLLGRFYDRAVRAVRTAEESVAGGFPHPVFVEPSAGWAAVGVDVPPPPGFTDDPRLVFAPPSRAAAGPGRSAEAGALRLGRGLALAERLVADHGAALWISEWGAAADAAGDGDLLRGQAVVADRHRLGGAFWRAAPDCGQQSGPVPPRSATAGAAGCDSGGAETDTEVAEVLGRSYPRAAPGRLHRLVSDPARRTMELAGSNQQTASSCVLDVWVPGRAEPVVQADGVRDVLIRAVAGGWRITGCATGDYRLAVR
ncbi:cellulase family glycosylhydrolase [Actinoalloteichus fjordicus]|uniref:Cellulase (Glycosyl hydrolase family 5) n=1 Tax=Actinoalloteichus fjordicus TaxID=1612552 RepID=A0AAC9PR43_9PSEU|nr:cellulase family glycosylhydrolase [Actinoalloteichus fjordicus]APU13446.1 Cellulase (glycosyl hydrolase family 5) [Actinoalloteichus fjordicus]